MTFKSALICLGLLSASAAMADTPMVPQPLAPSTGVHGNRNAGGKPAAKARLPAPMLNATRLVRQADGSVRMQCVDVPNPRARTKSPVERAAQPEHAQ
jgi:hypothetical protein